MAISPSVLWFQFAYSLWQFIRVAKFCRLPYALFAHTVMWILGKWSHPFALRTYMTLGTGRAKYYLSTQDLPGILLTARSSDDGTKKRINVVQSNPEVACHLTCLTFTKPVKYELCIKSAPPSPNINLSPMNESFVWNYLQERPECFATVSDLLWPGFAIVDRIGDLDGLKMICQGEYIPDTKTVRFLAVPDREEELNQNLLRLLSIIPLMVQAKGYSDLSVWISVAIIAVDQSSLFFNWMWQLLKHYLFDLFNLFMIRVGCKFRPKTRETVCTFFSTISLRMMYTDQVVRNFIEVKPGDVVYTMSPFNLADFDRITARPFTRRRKEPAPYDEEKFGFKVDRCDASVVTHEVGGSKICSIFYDDGVFLNFIDGEVLHRGQWKSAPCPEGSVKDNILDLLQIMEEMQMLPFRQTDDINLQSLYFNEFVSPSKSPSTDITYLVAKKPSIIGGRPAYNTQATHSPFWLSCG